MRLVYLLFFSFMALAAKAQTPQTITFSKLPTALSAHFSEHAYAKCYVQLKGDVDWSDYQTNWSKEQKGIYVYDKLKAREASLEVFLKEVESKASEMHYFFLTNGFEAIIDKELAVEFSEREEIKNIVLLNTESVLDVETEKDEELKSRYDPEDVEWGVKNIGALAFWDAGFTGQNVIVGGQDTGYEWDHPALKEKYRGWDGDTTDHNYNWHDAIRELNPMHSDTINPCGLDSEVPCDDNSHGTHTMGTMVGSEGTNLIGVAPDAKWIGCRNMERGYGTPTTYIECYEWFLAPTDLNNENPDPTKAPHVIANSWSCPEIEGCTPDIFPIMQQAVENLKRAGVFVVVSAGNDGRDGCATVNTPSAIYEASFTVGAIEEGDTLTNFSSKGPVLVDTSYRLKPNVVAPGRSVRSAVLNGEYGSKNGTSMSGPHVAGLVALIISAQPALSGQVETIEDIIERTARPIVADTMCGDTPLSSIPNNTFGYGAVDGESILSALVSATYELTIDEPLLFPNPVRDLLTVQWSQFTNQQVQVQIVDALGRPVTVAETPKNSKGVWQLDTSSLNKGVYFINLSSEGVYKTSTFIKS